MLCAEHINLMVCRCRKTPGRVQARKIKIGQFWGVVFHIADKHVTKVVVLQAGDINLVSHCRDSLEGSSEEYSAGKVKQ